MTPPTNKTPCTVLVAEDDADILDIIQTVLSTNGYSVIAVSDGEEVKKQLKTVTPHLFFLDVWMPGMGGKEVVKYLKNNSHYKDIPIILISAHASLKELTYEVGADNFLSKPFDIQDLIALTKCYCPPNTA
jgi:CheY-like chemotaxis protein